MTPQSHQSTSPQRDAIPTGLTFPGRRSLPPPWILRIWGDFFRRRASTQVQRSQPSWRYEPLCTVFLYKGVHCFQRHCSPMFSLVAFHRSVELNLSGNPLILKNQNQLAVLSRRNFFKLGNRAGIVRKHDSPKFTIAINHHFHKWPLYSQLCGCWHFDLQEQKMFSPAFDSHSTNPCSKHVAEQEQWASGLTTINYSVQEERKLASFKKQSPNLTFQTIQGKRKKKVLFKINLSNRDQIN